MFGLPFCFSFFGFSAGRDAFNSRMTWMVDQLSRVIFCDCYYAWMMIYALLTKLIDSSQKVMFLVLSFNEQLYLINHEHLLVDKRGFGLFVME